MLMHEKKGVLCSAFIVSTCLLVLFGQQLNYKHVQVGINDEESQLLDAQTAGLSNQHRHLTQLQPDSGAAVKHSTRKLRKKYCTQSLPENATRSVEKFIFFIGYARSGHSIIGSILDAHPNVVIAHEYSLFHQWLTMSEQQKNRDNLYSILYDNSCYNSHKGVRRHNALKKGYTLHINGSWQGRFQDNIVIIGDKSGGMTTKTYKIHHKEMARVYNEILTTVQVPIIAIHVVRNPFDNIATMLLFNNHISKKDVSTERPYSNLNGLSFQINSYFKQVESVVKMIDELNLNVIEIHNSDLIKNPKHTIRKLCQQLELKCSKQYIDTCSSTIFKHKSRSRFLVNWTPNMIDLVRIKTKSHHFLKDYSFFD